MKTQQVYKYGTGEDVPGGSLYLTTLVEENYPHYDTSRTTRYPGKTRLVWHYFLVEVE